VDAVRVGHNPLGLSVHGDERVEIAVDGGLPGRLSGRQVLWGLVQALYGLGALYEQVLDALAAAAVAVVAPAK